MVVAVQALAHMSPHELQQLALNFLATFLVVTLTTTVIHLHAPRKFLPT